MLMIEDENIETTELVTNNHVSNFDTFLQRELNYVFCLEVESSNIKRQKKAGMYLSYCKRRAKRVVSKRQATRSL